MLHLSCILRYGYFLEMASLTMDINNSLLAFRGHLLEWRIRCNRHAAMQHLAILSWALKLNQILVLQQHKHNLVSLFLALLGRPVPITRTVGLLQCFYLGNHPGALHVLRIPFNPVVELKLSCATRKRRKPGSKYFRNLIKSGFIWLFFSILHLQKFSLILVAFLRKFVFSQNDSGFAWYGQHACPSFHH